MFWHWTSERSSAAEFELLHDVVLTLGDRDRIIEAQRSERRRPNQADADRRADNREDWYEVLGDLYETTVANTLSAGFRWGINPQRAPVRPCVYRKPYSS
jgi:hypothetical protein